VLDLLPPEVPGLGAVAVLVLLPGMLLVRAPWTAVPALSMSFWVLTWWWVPLEGRTRQLAVVLPVFAFLLLLRLLPKHTVPPPPGYAGPPPEPALTGPTTGRPPRLRSRASFFVLGVGVLLLAPVGEWVHAPGREMAFLTTATRLAVWRDALPVGYEPLLPLAPFGVRGSALSTFAADVSLLSGLEPPRGVVAVTLLAAALAVLGLYALLGVHLRPGAAALGAVLGLGAVRWPGFLAPWGEGGALLALALALPAAALMVGHRSRPSAVGAGFLWAAAALAQPWLTLAVSAVSAFASPVVARRWILAFAVAVVLAAPPLVRMTGVLSVQEAQGALGSLGLAELVDFGLGIAIVVLCAALSERLLGEGGTRRGAVALALVGAALLVLRVHAWFAAGQLPLASRVELARLVRLTSPADVVCAPPGLVDWVPALAARAVGVPWGTDGAGDAGRPWVPPTLLEESTAEPRPACTRNMDASVAPK